jgi:hypothetical protein
VMRQIAVLSICQNKGRRISSSHQESVLSAMNFGGGITHPPTLTRKLNHTYHQRNVASEKAREEGESSQLTFRR